MSKRTLCTSACVAKRRLVRPTADDDFVICQNASYVQVLVLPSRCLVLPAADDDFVVFLDF